MSGLFNGGEYEMVPTLFDRGPLVPRPGVDRSASSSRCPACGSATVGECGPCAEVGAVAEPLL